MGGSKPYVPRRSSEHPSAPIEADDHRRDGTDGRSLQEALQRFSLQHFRHFHEISRALGEEGFPPLGSDTPDQKKAALRLVLPLNTGGGRRGRAVEFQGL